MKNKSKYFIIGIVIILFLVLSSFSGIVKYITDFMWFNEVGYTQTFLTKIKSQFFIGIPIFIILTVFLYLFINRLKKKYYAESDIIDTEHDKTVRFWIKIISAAISLITTLSIVSRLWFEILQYINAGTFNATDPIFNNDISFYVFNLPLINTLVNFIIDILFMLIVVTTSFYAYLSLRSSIKSVTNQIDNITQLNQVDFSKILNKKFATQVLNNISIIGSLIFIFIGIRFYLRSYDLLYSQVGRVFGAGFTDINITLNLFRILSIGCIVSSVTFFIGARKKNIKYALTLPASLIVISVIGTGLSGGIEKFIVEPDQLSKETEYMKYSISSTQKAYGLDTVQKIQFPAEDNLTKEDIENNSEVIENIRINDQEPLIQVYNQLQGIRPYYVFNDVDVDRYVINGQYKQVFLSARELDHNRLNEQAKTWVNQYLKYTHGYGITLSPVDRVTAQGQPEMIIKNIPPTTSTDIKLSRPEIYFGESANDYVILNTDEKEFDYPSGSDNVETVYNGKAGIKLSLINKLLFSFREASTKLLISTNINSESKIVINRNIYQRVEEIAPFLYYDPDAYIVSNQEDGKLYWIIEGFTVSNRYPYSMTTENFIEGMKVNYIRNSVKVVIDAYDGSINFFISDETDPIINTYDKIFTDLFKPMSEMPQGIRDHIRYSQSYFDIQSDLYRLYHIENPTVFFGREDYWDFSKEKYMDKEGDTVGSSYVMFKLHGEQNVEFLLTTQYSPQNKDNMIAMLAARNDGENYGELILYEFPKTKTITGPNMIETKIDQDTYISSQLTLWGQAGSSILRGNTLVVPIEDSLLYVEPIYLKSDTASNFPEMKMVVVSYANEIVMESTLDKALKRIFGTEEDKEELPEQQIPGSIANQTVNELVNSANELYKKADESLKSGDWASYGNYINQLKDTLNQLNTIINNGAVTNNNANTDNQTQTTEEQTAQ